MFVLIGFEFLCLIDSWSTTFIVDDDLNVSSFEFPEDLLKLVFNMIIVQKVYWIWANSSIIHKIVCIQRISLILIFHDSHLFVIRKVRGVINHLMLRAYFYQVKSWLSHLTLGRIC